jgi:hypothetical protein
MRRPLRKLLASDRHACALLYPLGMAARHVARLVVWAAACIGGPALLAAVLGRVWIGAGTVLAVLATLSLLLWLCLL